MTLRRKIFMTLSILLAAAIGSLAIALSHESPCEPGAATIGDAVRMKAIMSRCYGPPSVLTLEEVAKPVLAENQILVKVHAAGVNPLDWHTMRGEPYVMRLSSGFGRPKDVTVGVDFSGTVEAVGAQVTRFKVGDAVFGGRAGALGEYVVVREAGSVATKPDSISLKSAPQPAASESAFSPRPGSSPTFSTSAVATPSGNCRPWSRISVRRSGTENSTPSRPPRPAIASTHQ